MTTDFDPYDDQANDRDALQQWRRDEAAKRLGWMMAKRPAAFAAAGELHPDIRAWASRFLSGEPGNLVIVGAFGVGKSWSLWALHELLLDRQWFGRYDIADAYEIKEATAPPPDRQRLRAWAEADLLAIDDAAAQRVSDWDLDLLTPIVDRRWKHQRAIILTSNEAGLKDVFGPRISSRLRDGATFVTLTGDDRRRAR